MAIVINPKPFEISDIIDAFREIDNTTDKLDAFYVDLFGDKTHPRSKEIQERLKEFVMSIDEQMKDFEGWLNSLVGD